MDDPQASRFSDAMLKLEAWKSHSSSRKLGLADEPRKNRVNKTGAGRTDEPTTTSSAPLCRPWSRADLLARLATFKSSTWFAKPQEAGPVACAARGWINVDTDMLACQCCGSRISLPIPSAWSRRQAEQVARVFAQKLDSGHHIACPWPGHECDVALLQFPSEPRSTVVATYTQRCQTLMQLPQLPVLSAQALSQLGTWQPELLQLLMEGSCPIARPCMPSAEANKEAESYIQALKLLALCGWEPHQIGGTSSSGMIECDMCGVRVGLQTLSLQSRPPLGLNPTAHTSDKELQPAIGSSTASAKAPAQSPAAAPSETNDDALPNTNTCHPIARQLSLSIAGGPLPVPRHPGGHAYLRAAFGFAQGLPMSCTVDSEILHVVPFPRRAAVSTKSCNSTEANSAEAMVVGASLNAITQPATKRPRPPPTDSGGPIEQPPMGKRCRVNGDSSVDATDTDHGGCPAKSADSVDNDQRHGRSSPVPHGQAPTDAAVISTGTQTTEGYGCGGEGSVDMRNGLNHFVDSFVPEDPGALHQTGFRAISQSDCNLVPTAVEDDAACILPPEDENSPGSTLLVSKLLQDNEVVGNAKGMEFDVLTQHRPYCPWVFAPFAASGRLCGWKQTLRALEKELLDGPGRPEPSIIDELHTSGEKLVE